MANTVPSSLGLPVTTRTFSFKEMAIRAWGSEFSAPDHQVYEMSGGRGFDSTDRGTTGIYSKTVGSLWSASQTSPTADTINFTADGA